MRFQICEPLAEAFDNFLLLLDSSKQKRNKADVINCLVVGAAMEKLADKLRKVLLYVLCEKAMLHAGRKARNAFPVGICFRVEPQEFVQRCF